MAERLLQPPANVTAAARHLAGQTDGIDSDRLAWIASGGEVGRSTLLALLAAGVSGTVGAWATRTYAGMVDREHDGEIRALTAAAATQVDDGRYFGILLPGQDVITAVIRASADGLSRWSDLGWLPVPEDMTPVGLPYREIDGPLLAAALTCVADGNALMLRPTVPRAFLNRRVPLTAAAGRLDGVYAAVDEADTTAVLDLVKVDGHHHYTRRGGDWQLDDDAMLPYLVASGSPLALVPDADLPPLLRAFDDHQAVFPLLADVGEPDTGPSVAGTAVRAADTGRVLMLQRANTPDDPAAGDWEFPGGHLEDGEDPLTGGAREWCEETGMQLPDDAEHTGGWTSPDGVYQGNVLTVPGEDSIDLHQDRGAVTNPDDPDGDQVESIAWWDPSDLAGNPAVRAELLRDLAVVLPALTGQQQAIVGDDDTDPSAVTAAGRHGPFRFRHGWIPINGTEAGGSGKASHAAKSAEHAVGTASQHAAARSVLHPSEHARFESLTRGGMHPHEAVRTIARENGPQADQSQLTSHLPRPKPKPPRESTSRPLAPGADSEQLTSHLPAKGSKGGKPAAMNDQQYEAHTAQIESKIGAALKAGQATDKTEAIDADAGVWKPERAALHKQIVNDMYGRQAKTAGSDGKAVIAGGLGGAGKSTVLGKHLGVNPKDYVTVNPDDVKEEMAKLGMVPKIEGLSPMEAAALVHEESSHIANLIARRAMADHKNIIYDITMSSKGSVQRRLDELKEHGYSSPRGVFVDIPVETSVQRALARHRRGMEQHRAGEPGALGGRYVPPSIIRQNKSSTASSANREVFDSLRGQFGSSDLFDNSGSAPKRIEGGGTHTAEAAPVQYGKGEARGSGSAAAAAEADVQRRTAARYYDQARRYEQRPGGGGGRNAEQARNLRQAAKEAEAKAAEYEKQARG